MALLFDTDYTELEERGMSFLEFESERFLVLKAFPLPPSVYIQPDCDVLVVIPPNYNQAGNDMFWTYPKLELTTGQPIPATGEPAADSRTFQGLVFCRWSRHWNAGATVWRPGVDNVVTILNRLTWALNHPDTK